MFQKINKLSSCFLIKQAILHMWQMLLHSPQIIIFNPEPLQNLLWMSSSKRIPVSCQPISPLRYVEAITAIFSFKLVLNENSINLVIILFMEFQVWAFMKVILFFESSVTEISKNTQLESIGMTLCVYLSISPRRTKYENNMSSNFCKGILGNNLVDSLEFNSSR